MPLDVQFIKAEKHTSEYLMHKYWARKPHNVIRECISSLTEKGDVVLDPFCGSGVTIREGALIGRNCYGFDLNPTAILISSVLINPPTMDSFIKEYERIFDEVYSKYGYLYKTSDGKTIRYLSHRIIAKCDCGSIVSQSECTKSGKLLLCPNCGASMRFNLEHFIDTEVFNISVENEKSYVPSVEELSKQKEYSSFSDTSVNTDCFDYAFPENRRILSFAGITTSSFFTNRNFCILSSFAERIWDVEDEPVKNGLLLLLTASVAQCSRLIASRNNLSTGGPAWSVPGFWVPKEHLETNPFVHLNARLKKFKKALEKLLAFPPEGEASVICGDSLELLNHKPYSNLKADLIFLDPPYGDSVPYTEFSNIWNSFLKEIPNSEDDISVSNRISLKKSWDNYSKKLDEYMCCFANLLKDNGKLLITFNNNDMQAWLALIAALQKNHYVCRTVFYQLPAVIPAKAQMSIKSSYISDVYSVYTQDLNMTVSKDLDSVVEHLCFVANARDGKILKTVLDREFIIVWLKNNIDYQLLSRKKNIIKKYFDYDSKTASYIIKDQYRVKTESLKTAMIESMEMIGATKEESFLDCYVKINEMCKKYGTIELSEFRLFWEEYFLSPIGSYQENQLSLFE